ncbi:hypothetical protein C2G38_2111178 [Gigaspora rosea]|uniref:Uncharacterized protein n=1 Tax=Gigaspora rosea TaxID=44941 RepID=A0A397UMP6_9GLOM|nr:hypothetical protein C2G38_2111178 [Gigaspora rosea]
MVCVNFVLPFFFGEQFFGINISVILYIIFMYWSAISIFSLNICGDQFIGYTVLFQKFYHRNFLFIEYYLGKKSLLFALSQLHGNPSLGSVLQD